MKHTAWLSCVTMLIVAFVYGGAGSDSAGVTVVRLTPENFAKYAAEGKEADAIAGDIVLQNAHLTAVIAQPLETRNANMTVKQAAGALIDFTARAQPSDQLSAFYPGKRAYPFRAWDVRLGKEGTPGLAGETQSATADVASIIVSAEAGENRPAVVVTYTLRADEPFLEVTTRFTNPADAPMEVPLTDDLRIDGGKEDLEKSPNGVGPVFWAHDKYWRQAYAIEAVGHQLEMNSDPRTTTLKYRDPAERDTLTLRPGESFLLTRRLFAGANLLDVKAAVAAAHQQATTPVTFLVQGGRRPVPDAEITVSLNGVPFGSGRTDSQGRLVARLPAGEYRAAIQALGVPLTAENAGPAFVVGTEPAKVDLRVPEFDPGLVQATITDAAGQPLPCKVEFIAREGTPQPGFGPESAAYAVKNLRYAPHGQFEQTLPAGQYQAIVSHGPEYEAVFADLTVPPGGRAELTAKLTRSVDTAGWISGDFHSHSSPSGDNTSSQLGRVLNLVAEQIEFAPCTEHNRVSTYVPHIEALNISRFLATTSGIELTGIPLPLNHQNAFPMVYTPYVQDGGGPQTDADPEVQIERLALWDNRSDKLVQVNHPDIGWMFHDRDGDQQPDRGYERMIPHMEVMEIHPIDNALFLGPFETLRQRAGNSRVFNWLQLLNQGHRIPAVVNTDAHYNFHGSGGLRNWIQSPTDDPAKIAPLDVVHACEQGRVIVSNGPFLEVTAREVGRGEAVTAGQDLSAASGRVTLAVRVQCPNWFDVDRVFVLVNGRPQENLSFSRQQQPERFRKMGAVRFEAGLELTLKEDAHVIVVTGGAESRLGPVAGPEGLKIHPAALSNPIFVDVDGGGWMSSGDTLGHPLPVKYVPPKTP